MGNNSSKQKSKDGLQAYPSFSRTDTQGSTRSSRSMRSRLSVVSNNSEAASYKSAVDGPDSNPATTTTSTTNTTPTNNPPGSGANDEGYPFPSVDQSTLPKSMQQIEPKEPILIRRDQHGNITTPTASSFSASSSSPGAGTSSSDGNDDNSKNNDIGNSSVTNPDSSSGAMSIPTPTAKSGSFTRGGFLTPSNPSTPSAGAYSASPGGGPARGGFFISATNGSGGSINIDEVIQRLLDAGYSGKTSRSICLKSSEIAAICQAAREIFLAQPPLLELSPPVKIVGDVHGQYGDLLRMFDICGFPPAANYLFLGDYVDRGKQSLETILLLLCYKIKYPENFFLLRGNHECANVTRVYGFYDECKRRCNIKTWRVFIDTFNTLPITAVVAHKIFCVHGGLSPSLNSLDEIRDIERPTDVPDYGLLNDLLWSDPADTVNEWEDNERGVSYCFSKVAINRFLAKFGFDLVCRAHMVVEDGYEFFNDRSLVTVFSAPNYCGEFDNWGAVMSVSEELLCSFELLKPLDSAALKQEMKRAKHERRSVLMNSASPLHTPRD